MAAPPDHPAIDRINVILNQDRRDGPVLDLLEVADGDGKFSVDVFRTLFLSPRRWKAVLSEAIQWETDGEAEGRSLADGLRGGAIELASAAFIDELAFFFPESQRHILREMLAVYREAANQMGELTAAMLKNTVAEALKAIVSPAPAAT